MLWCGVAMGVAFGSALIPLISIEFFVLGLIAREPGIHWLALGAAVAIGQVAGKSLYYLAARGSLRLPAFLHRGTDLDRPRSDLRQRWHERTATLRARVHAVVDKCHRHPRWMLGTYGVSSVVGLPPFMATTVLAGLARMPIGAYLSAGLLGRFVRFSALAAAPALVAGWLV